MAGCILDLNNTNIKELNINASNGYQLITTNNSIINKATFLMAFNEGGLPTDIIDTDLISTNYSSMNIDNLDIRSITDLTTNIIYSFNNSKVFVNRIYGLGGASPEWTGKFDTMPLYGNNMSYNVYSGDYSESNLVVGDIFIAVTRYIIPTTTTNLIVSDNIIANSNYTLPVTTNMVITDYVNCTVL